MKDFLNKLNSTAISLGAEYAEARALRLTKTSLTLKEEQVEAAKQGIESGVAVRVLVNGAWGFASAGSLELVTSDNAVLSACRMAKLASTRLKIPIKLAPVKVIEDRVVAKPKKDPSHVSMEEKIQTALKINRSSIGFDSRVKSCGMDYLDLTGNSFFVNS
ncbi:MAG: DNA gyrase modulator, partial [Candidatus Bathyarchaeia archaeon]